MLKSFWQAALRSPIVQGLALIAFLVTVNVNPSAAARAAVLVFLWFLAWSLIMACYLTWQNIRVRNEYLASVYTRAHYRGETRDLGMEFGCILFVHLFCFPIGAWSFMDQYRAMPPPYLSKEGWTLSFGLLATGMFLQGSCCPDFDE